MSRRELLFDANVSATGLNPGEVAECNQAIQIYNPESQKYLMVSNSAPKLSESDSTFVCIDDNYKGGGKQLSLECVGENEYYIKTMDDDGEKETGFLYVSENVSSGIMESSANVLKREKIIGKKELYIFQFIRHSEQMGVFKIRCKENKKVLFTSSAASGSYIKADNRDHEKSNLIWFQLNIKPHRDIETSVVEEKDFGVVGSHTLVEDIYNDSNYEFKHGFKDGQEEVCSLLAKIGIIYERWSGLQSDNIQVVKPRKQMRVLSSVTVAGGLREKKLEIKFAGNTLEGWKLLPKGSSSSTSLSAIESEIEAN